MKILMVSEDLPGTQLGGLGKHVVTLANALLELGPSPILELHCRYISDQHCTSHIMAEQ